jgi:hypothetical protein
VLLCVHIRPGESPASALLRTAAAAAVPLGDASGGPPSWNFLSGERAVLNGIGPALELKGATGVALCGRLLGGMKATARGGAAAAAAEEGVAALATARQTRSRLEACIRSVRGLQCLVDRLGSDLLQAGAAGGPRLPVGGEASRVTSARIPSAEARQQLEKAKTNQMTQARVQSQVEAGEAKGLEPQRTVLVPPAADGVSADAEGTTAVKFDEAADDDELFLQVFKDMDKNGDDVVSREWLDKVLESWTGNRELVERVIKFFGIQLSSDKFLSGKISNFSPEDDDVELLQHTYDLFSEGACLTMQQLEAQSQISMAQNDHYERDLLRKLNEHLQSNQCAQNNISFPEFQAAANLVPRLKGHRIMWTSILGLSEAFARHLKVGDLRDPLAGIRTMTDEEIEQACMNFVVQDMIQLVQTRIHSLRSITGLGSTQSHNSKFCMSNDGSSFTGTFGDLQQFHDGHDKLIGTPNPKVLEGIQREHCSRANALKSFTSTNYGIVTCPADEWEFVTDPKFDRTYPHTPVDPKLWKVPKGETWKGPSGRSLQPIEKFEEHDMCIRCKLKRGELVSLRLYTGPMFNLYNCVLRKFPEDIYASLEENKYETTLFCIISGIIKLSKETLIPPSRRLWRGLGGMILPEQFWKQDSKGFRGGVELGLLSTTSERSVAIQYSGSGSRAGMVFEIVAGRIDIGAELGWLSQYPGESEYLFPPLTCLEVCGEPRSEGNTVIFPLRANVCLKGLTLEQLEERRKDLHKAMAWNLKEELAIYGHSSLIPHQVLVPQCILFDLLTNFVVIAAF